MAVGRRDGAEDVPAAGARPKRATIHDVAKAAGVAASTVSRSFSDPARVNSATREHVLTVAASLGYRPHPIARALPRGQTSTLALIVPDITNPFFFDIIRGAERQAAAAGYTLVLADASESAEAEHTHLDRLVNAVDGFILASSRLPEARIRALAGERPVVLINKSMKDVPSVVVDNDQGMRQAAEHLASLGHRSLAYLSGPSSSWSDRTRWRALVSAGRRLDLEVTRLGPFSPTVAGGAAGADSALVADVTALIAFNDLVAIGAMRRLRDRGLHVPRSISVMGSDDIFSAELCTPSLTTIAADIEQTGRWSVDLLLTTGSGRTESPTQKVVVPTQLRIRESTDVAQTRRNRIAR